MPGISTVAVDSRHHRKLDRTKILRFGQERGVMRTQDVRFGLYVVLVANVARQARHCTDQGRFTLSVTIEAIKRQLASLPRTARGPGDYWLLQWSELYRLRRKDHVWADRGGSAGATAGRRERPKGFS